MFLNLMKVLLISLFSLILSSLYAQRVDRTPLKGKVREWTYSNGDKGRIHKYDSLGNKTEWLQHGGGSYNHFYTNVYDSSSNLVKSTDYDENESVNQYEVFLYDSSNRLVKSSTYKYSLASRPESQREYIYDSLGLLSTETFGRWWGGYGLIHRESKKTYHYNEKRQLIKEEYFEFINDKYRHPTEIIYQYNAKGLLISALHKNKYGVPTFTASYTYDSFNRLIKHVDYNFDEEGEKYYFDSTEYCLFDKYGNWGSSKFSNIYYPEKIRHKLREFTYWE